MFKKSSLSYVLIKALDEVPQYINQHWCLFVRVFHKPDATNVRNTQEFLTAKFAQNQVPVSLQFFTTGFKFSGYNALPV